MATHAKGFFTKAHMDETTEQTPEPDVDARVDLVLGLMDAGAMDASLYSDLRAWRPKTPDDLHSYIKLLYGYDIPTVAVCDGHCAPMDAVAALYFMEEPDKDTLWVGGRGSGKTLSFAICEHLLMDHFHDTITNAGAVDEQAQVCYRYIQGFDAKPWFRYGVKRSILSRTEYHSGAYLIVIPGTPAKCNGPHTRLLAVDELDLFDGAALNEAVSIPISVNGRPPQTVYTSSLKKPFGHVVEMLNDAEEGKRAIAAKRWCVFEVIQNCPPERHKGGVGCRGTGVPRPGMTFPDDACPLAAECLTRVVSNRGEDVFADGPGKAAKSQGFMPIDDVIKKYRTIDSDTWRSQWRSERPSIKGLIYPDFTAKNIIPRGTFTWNPQLPVYAGVDFGFANATAMVFAQVTGDNKIVVFAEWIMSGYTSPETARIFKSLPYGEAALRPGGWVVGDPAAADARNVWMQNGIPIIAANNSVGLTRRTEIADDDSGIAKVRWALSPMGGQVPILYITEECPILIKQMRVYHTKDVPDDRNLAETPQKVDDHGPDGLRYLVAKLINNRSEKKKKQAA